MYDMWLKHAPHDDAHIVETPTVFGRVATDLYIATAVSYLSSASEK